MSFFVLISVFFVVIKSACNQLYTTGTNEVCRVTLANDIEICNPFSDPNGIINNSIANSNGFSINPVNNIAYGIVSIGSKNGERVIIEINPCNAIILSKYVSVDSHKYAGITHDNNGQLYGVTGSQNDHELYALSLNSINNTVKATSLLEIQKSKKGIGVTYDTNNDKIYIATGDSFIIISEITINAEVGMITKIYCVAKIINKHETFIKLHYIGWSSTFDIEINYTKEVHTLAKHNSITKLKPKRLFYLRFTLLHVLHDDYNPCLYCNYINN